MKQFSSPIIIVLGLGVTLLLCICIAIYYTATVSNPGPGNCSSLKKSGDLWSDDCSTIVEKDFDGTLKQPSKPLYLSGFRESKSFGKPLGANTWYRYRYVNSKTGGYSKFSPWTESPIIAGGKNLPCKDGDCSSLSQDGNFCKSNIVELSIDGLDYSMSDNIYANVHRYASPNGEKPTDTTENDKAVGYLLPSGAKTWTFVDVSSSVCDEPNIVCHTHKC